MSAREPRRLARRAKELGVRLLAFDSVERLAARATGLAWTAEQLAKGLLALGDAEGERGRMLLATFRWSWDCRVAVGPKPMSPAVRGEEPRFRVLAPLREFARQRLDESTESEAARDRHEQIVLASVEPVAPPSVRSARGRPSVISGASTPTSST